MPTQAAAGSTRSITRSWVLALRSRQRHRAAEARRPGQPLLLHRGERRRQLRLAPGADRDPPDLTVVVSVVVGTLLVSGVGTTPLCSPKKSSSRHTCKPHELNPLNSLTAHGSPPQEDTIAARRGTEVNISRLLRWASAVELRSNGSAWSGGRPAARSAITVSSGWKSKPYAASMRRNVEDTIRN
jgi:hypothetical protein